MNNYFQKMKSYLKTFLKDPLFLGHWEDPYRSRARPQDGNQLSVRISGSSCRKPYLYRGDAYMFTEDLFGGLMPFTIYRGVREKYPSRVVPASPEKERLVASALSDDRRHYPDLTDSLCDFVRDAAQVLLSYGVAFYEIVEKRNSAGEIESFALESIPPCGLIRFFGNYYQFVLWKEARISRVRVQVVKIPANKILKIEFPQQLGGRSGLNSVLKRLWELSSEIIPEFHIKAMEAHKTTGFDMKQYDKSKYLEIAKLTRNLGWNQRKRSDGYITEYYSMIRFLREKRAEALLREEILSSVNTMLNSSFLNLGVKVEIDNLFTVKDVEEQEELLKAGDVEFMSVFNRFKI